MNYKLIATDMDGTLLNDEHSISKGNIEAIKEVQKKGIKFVLASGRPSFAMFSYAKELEMDKYGGYVLSFNGGQLIDMSDRKVIFHEGLGWKDIEKIYNVSQEIDIPMVLYENDTIYASKDTENTRFEAMLCGMKFVEFKNLEELDNYGIKETTKCMLISEPDRIKEAEKHMKSKYENEYFIAISKPVFLEIANKNINKGKTLRILGELTNIKMEEVIAVGDSYNDIPLLEVAGMPVAVSNANEEIKKISRFESTSNNDDALKTVIERFFE